MERTCETCTQTRLCGGTCIDMTCYSGFVDGDHDGWTNSEPLDMSKWPNEVEKEDLTYKPFANLKS